MEHATIDNDVTTSSETSNIEIVSEVMYSSASGRELEPRARVLQIHVFPGDGDRALNFPMLQGSFCFLIYFLNLFFKNSINIQYFNYSRKNE